MKYNEITGIILFKPPLKPIKKLGPGLLESVYQMNLAPELNKKGLKIEKEVAILLKWDNLTFDVGFRADLNVEDMNIIELKSVESILDVHKRQLLTYLKLPDKRVGLLINFNESILKNGITKIVSNLQE